MHGLLAMSSLAATLIYLRYCFSGLLERFSAGAGMAGLAGSPRVLSSCLVTALAVLDRLLKVLPKSFFMLPLPLLNCETRVHVAPYAKIAYASTSPQAAGPAMKLL